MKKESVICKNARTDKGGGSKRYRQEWMEEGRERRERRKGERKKETRKKKKFTAICL